ncbi:M15 family metallopeptidase [Lichenibacterium dinghuense]|uniref:M15 family metallopeptidase n=1 Tax=Lichenibacterium dinghuense TaxID=2895977 RepID=UPI001F3E72F4|nr:M15 family metallopeptidase [Lichenibacterium sp. 6Y81]
MASLSDVVDIPSNLNVGLTACPASHLLQKFGSPGSLTPKCSPFTGPSKNLIRTDSVGPFRVTGMGFAIDSLSDVFDQVNSFHPEVYAAIHTAGMLCVRANKASTSAYSNHSWGCAIDLYFGSDVVPFGAPKTQLGFLYIYEFFRQAGWYWGAGFSGKKDAMHFELSREAIDSVAIAPSPGAELVAAADYARQMGYDDVEEPA